MLLLEEFGLALWILKPKNVNHSLFDRFVVETDFRNPGLDCKAFCGKSWARSSNGHQLVQIEALWDCGAIWGELRFQFCGRFERMTALHLRQPKVPRICTHPKYKAICLRFLELFGLPHKPSHKRGIGKHLYQQSKRFQRHDQWTAQHPA